MASTIHLHLETTFASVENQVRANQEHSRDEVCSGNVESDDALKKNCKKKLNFQVVLCVCLLSVAIHGQENDKDLDVKKLVKLFKKAKDAGFDFSKVDFDKVVSL